MRARVSVVELLLTPETWLAECWVTASRRVAVCSQNNLKDYVQRLCVVRRIVCERRLAVANNVTWSLACCSLGSCPEALLALNCVTPSLADHDHMPTCARRRRDLTFPFMIVALHVQHNADVKEHRNHARARHMQSVPRYST
jgi:hypothetical protein